MGPHTDRAMGFLLETIAIVVAVAAFAYMHRLGWLW